MPAFSIDVRCYVLEDFEAGVKIAPGIVVNQIVPYVVGHYTFKKFNQISPFVELPFTHTVDFERTGKSGLSLGYSFGTSYNYYYSGNNAYAFAVKYEKKTMLSGENGNSFIANQKGKPDPLPLFFSIGKLTEINQYLMINTFTACPSTDFCEFGTSFIK